MFTKANSCPVCFADWEGVDGRCAACGSIAELYYERPLPKSGEVNEQRIEQTITRVRAYLVDHENHGQARYTLGLAYVNMGLLPEGLVEIRRAAQLLPEKVQVAYEAAALAAKQSDFSDEVADQINRTIERKPDFKEALFLRGVIQSQRNEMVDAVRSWQDAYELDQDYDRPYQALHKFNDSNRKLLRNPSIAATIDKFSLPQNARDYLDLIASGEPVRPPPLGETSMKVLEDIWPEKAKVMRQMYSEDLHDYRVLTQQRSVQRGALENDVVALSELCIAAVEAREYLNTAAVTSAQVFAPTSSRQLTIAERSQILDAEVRKYQKQGYALVARTDTTAQLSKKHEFSCCLALILVFLIIGILLYLLYYLTAKKEYLVYLEVDEYGRIHRTSN